MVSVYCNRGIYDEDNCQSAEEGDVVSKLVYQDKDLIEQTAFNVKITSISETGITAVLNSHTDLNLTDILFEDIVSFEL